MNQIYTVHCCFYSLFSIDEVNCLVVIVSCISVCIAIVIVETIVRTTLVLALICSNLQSNITHV